MSVSVIKPVVADTFSLRFPSSITRARRGRDKEGPMKNVSRFSREVTIAASKDINDEEGFFVMLLILALLFCPSLAEEELQGRSTSLLGRLGRGGFEPPTPWFVATCSNPLSYRPHPVSTGSVPGVPSKEPFLSPAISG
ncbi:hypothetical protein HAX54_033062 [Datura stramonium]|uniref:Uncharacterized protein n=1 Tax=Datura stramonium TaxID=4076 RepID=A0ABS8VD71_DATST|nr:hypothetical protein [Datura stramonium]